MYSADHWIPSHLINSVQVLYLSVGQRYSVMIRLDQTPGNYSLRFATYPTGDMQQVLEGQAIVSYSVRSDPVRYSLSEVADCKQEFDGHGHFDGGSE